ncbi:hypothetical protein J7L49_06670 [Candidatus Bathyarchaeota archaeon]|nr:hypothetical protein [Candidatus Bathyarchaeota archaeon]
MSEKTTFWKYFAFASFWIFFNAFLDLILMFFNILPINEYRISKTTGFLSLAIGTSFTTMFVYIIENWRR